MKKSRPIDQIPIRILQAQYEYFILKVYGRRTLKQYSDAMSEFFRVFPDRDNPEDFFRDDFQDYVIIRQREKTHPMGIAFEISVLKTFWTWMIEQKGLPLANPVSARVPRYARKQKDRMSLKDFMRLMSEVHDPRLLVAVRCSLNFERLPDLGITKNSLGSLLRRACERAGLASCGLSRLPHAVHHAALQLLLPSIPESTEGIPL